MEKRVFVSDKIGDQYMNWTAGDKIFITAYTGTGKSHFILYEYLKKWLRGAAHGKILYLVNRKILKKQLEEELSTKVQNALIKEFGVRSIYLKNYIEFATYQEIEDRIQHNDPNLQQYLFQFTSFVYDECHYFYNDSNFNTRTEMAFDMLTMVFNRAIHIFMSATMDNVKDFILTRNPRNPHIQYAMGGNRIYEYSLSKEYDYIKLHVFDKMDNLRNNIVSSVNEKNEKWLIFTDSIEGGKRFRKSLIYKEEKQANLEPNDVVFIDADYVEDLQSRDAVDEVIQKEAMSYKVVISTSVMDNGISFHDGKVRNIVILADTKESFLQMLGRKREDGQNLNVYICRQNLEYFTHRRQYWKRIIEFHDKNNQFWLQQKHYVKSEWEIVPVQPVERRYIVGACNYNNQQYVLEQLSRSSEACEAYRKLCYPLDGQIYTNTFSVYRVKQLIAFYDNMIARMQESPNAFVYEQAQWMQKSLKEIEDCIVDSDDIKFKKLQSDIDAVVSKYLKTMTKEENLVFRENIRGLLKELNEYCALHGDELAKTDAKDFGKVSYDEKKDGVKTNERTLTPDRFNRSMQKAKLPYIMEKEDKNFLIIKID